MAPRLPAALTPAPDAPLAARESSLPLVARQLPRKQGIEVLPIVRKRERTIDVRQIQETVTRRVEESLERRVLKDVESVLARELAPDSPLAQRLGSQFYGRLYEGLVLERERIGWG